MTKLNSKSNIIDEIEKNKGHQFDPEIADIMLRLIREDKLHIISWMNMKNLTIIKNTEQNDCFCSVFY